MAVLVLSSIYKRKDSTDGNSGVATPTRKGTLHMQLHAYADTHCLQALIQRLL